MKARHLALALPLAVVAGSALAHPGHGAAGFASGFGHPLGGADHLLAMLAVGLYAARERGTARAGVPLAFVAAMLAGAGLSVLGVALPLVEAGIAASVLVLGLLIAFMVRLPLVASLPLIAGFAVFHGHAHHAEMGDGSVLAFTVGFALATAALHGFGYALARGLPETGPGRALRRLAGAAVAAAGLVFLGGA
ncbi:MAG TPA: HupE/UreJ family protein [Rhodocyclaceae bacterium]|nr:HupE/UreJ family protein [Rhodocyclaceae bacterium]